MMDWSMARTAALGAGLALCLSACSKLPTAPAAHTRYDLGPPIALPAAAPGAPALPAVAMAALQAPLQSDGSTAVHYRLAYADAQQLHAYSQARWSLPPAQLVQQRLNEHLSQGGRVVLSAQAGDIPPALHNRQVPVLRLTLEEFSQVFSSAQSSVGWVRVRATLVDPAPQGDVLLAQQVFEAREPAQAANASAGVRALAQGVDRVGQALAQWVTARP